jgi:hypothetical protein
MPAVTNTLLRTAILIGIAGCGSVVGEGPPGGEFDDDGGLGYVGSGGGGGFGDAAGGDGSASDGGHGGSPGSDASTDDADILDGAPSDGGAAPSDGAPGSDASGADGGSTVGVTFNVPGGFFPSLDWVIAGPSGHYSGEVLFGDAHSYEFVVGGIQAGSGYILTLSGNDIYGDPCNGSSSPFEVSPGVVSGAGVAITCFTADAQSAPVTTGSVGIDAGVVLSSP